MAALPPQQARRRSPLAASSRPDDVQEQLNFPHGNLAERQDLDSSSTSDFILADATSTSAESLQEQDAAHIPHPDNDDEPRRCWICFSDETEDTPESGIWRTPCPCNLTAHETCLLQWVADIEAPKQGRSTATPADIKCPQCKSKIYLSRPRSYVVEAVGAIEKATGRALLPAVLLSASYTILLSCSHHGAHTIRMLFGTAEADRILEPLQPADWSIFERYAMLHFPTIASPFFRSWRGLRVELGLPLIPAALVASRTRLADAVLPILPIVFFATNPRTSGSLSIGYWPPSPALTFVLLPYIRSAYGEYMERVWAPHEKRWVEEVKPRLGAEEADNAENNANNEAAADNEDAEEIINIEIGVDMDLFDDDDGEDDEDNAFRDHEPVPRNLPAQELPQQAPPLHAPPQDDNVIPNDAIDLAQAAEADVVIPPEAEQNAQPPPQEAPRAQPPQRRRHEIDLLTSATRVSDAVIGALLFPTISAGCGELLRLILPLSWTVASKHAFSSAVNTPHGGILDRLLDGYWGFGMAGSAKGGQGRIIPTGLLQTRWGRSVVGGCLFVVVKDMLRVYCRWRMAVSFRERKVRDWDRKLGRLVD